MKVSKSERDEALAQLRKLLPPGSTVYNILRRVSRSGMSRTIAQYVLHDGGMRYLSGYVSKVLALPLDRDRAGVKVSGCGMDVGFEVVYNLSHVLFPRDPNSSNDAGYKLRSEWL